MSISPIHCPESGCFWSTHGIPDQYTEARNWHLAAHRAEEHGEPLTEEQIAYAARAGHVIPGTAKTTAAVAALPVPVGDTRLAEALAAYEGHPDLGFACCSAHAVADHAPVLLADNVRLRLALKSAQRGRREARGLLEITEASRKRWRNGLIEADKDREALRARIAELEAERHSTNEALDEAVQALRDMRDRSAEQTRYAAHLEAEVCQCQPELESGEYMHEATCPVAEIQMRMLGCPGFEGNPVAPGLCAGCHEPREDHGRPGMHHAIRTIDPAEEAAS